MVIVIGRRSHRMSGLSIMAFGLECDQIVLRT